MKKVFSDNKEAAITYNDDLSGDFHLAINKKSWADEDECSPRWRCECGEFHGRVFRGEICPKCQKPVEFRDVDPMVTGWIPLDQHNKEVDLVINGSVIRNLVSRLLHPDSSNNDTSISKTDSPLIQSRSDELRFKVKHAPHIIFNPYDVFMICQTPVSIRWPYQRFKRFNDESDIQILIEELRNADEIFMLPGFDLPEWINSSQISTVHSPISTKLGDIIIMPGNVIGEIVDGTAQFEEENIRIFGKNTAVIKNK